MEQVYNLMSAMIQNMSEISPAVKKVNEGDSSNAGKFKDLFQQKKADAADSKTKETAEAAESVDSNNKAETLEEDSDENVLLVQELLAGQILSFNTPGYVFSNVQAAAAEAGITIREEDGALVVAQEAEGQPVLYAEEETLISAEPVSQQTEAVSMAENPVELPEAQENENTQQVKEALPIVQESPEKEETEQKNTIDVSVSAETPLFREVQTAPIKVAETESPAEAAEASDVKLQVESGLADALEKGESKVEIKLEPEALGKVTIEITQRGGEEVNIVLKAESFHTQRLLERHVSDLHMFLADRGQKVDQVEIQRWQESQQSDNNRNFYQDQNEGHGRRQPQEQRKHAERNEDFLHQLRLGLVPLEEVS